MISKLKISEEQISGFCKKNHIRKLSLFGSALRDDFTSKSDIDFLVEFEPGHTPGLSFFEMQEELSEIISRKADLNTKQEISPYFRDEILNKAQDLYVSP